jgi:hypothetical protein
MDKHADGDASAIEGPKRKHIEDSQQGIDDQRSTST